MLASAARTYLNQFGVLPGKSVILFTNNDHAYGTAIDFANKGAKVTIVDNREDIPSDLSDRCNKVKIKIYPSHSIINTHGYQKVKKVEIQKVDQDNNELTGSLREIECDLVLMSGGWNPSVQLFSQSRGKLQYHSKLNSFIPKDLIKNQKVVGCNNGDFNLLEVLKNSYQAGLDFATELGKSANKSLEIETAFEDLEFTEAKVEPYMIGKKKVTHGSKHFVDFQHDVTAAAVTSC